MTIRLIAISTIMTMVASILPKAKPLGLDKADSRQQTADVPNAFIELSASQISLFSGKLVRLPELGNDVP